MEDTDAEDAASLEVAVAAVVDFLFAEEADQDADAAVEEEDEVDSPTDAPLAEGEEEDEEMNR
jgi:hypothetical protein